MVNPCWYAAASGWTPYTLAFIQVTFNRAINPATLTPSDIILTGPNGKSGNTYTADFIELTNFGAQDEDVSGWILRA